MPAVLGSVNVYLIRTKDGVSLVDTGLLDKTGQGELRHALSDRNLKFSDIETVFLTHYHPDHAGLARFLQQHGAKIYISKIDASALFEFYRRPEKDAERSMFYKKCGLPEEFSNSSLSAFSFMRKLGEDFEPDGFPKDGETIVLSGIPFEVLACPGHTPGHLCLLSRDLRIAFTGDTVISPKTTHISATETEHGEDPYFDFVGSLSRLESLGAITPLSGHGSHQKNLGISAHKIKSYLMAELTSLFERLTDTPMSAFALSQTVKEMRPRVFPQWLAVSQTAAYLNHLVLRGDASCDDSSGVRLFRRKTSSSP